MKSTVRFLMLTALVMVLALFPACISPKSTTSAGESATEQTKSLVILMYHGILPDTSHLLGEYVVAVSEFESDLAYLTKNGYQTVSMQEVVNFVKHGGNLPEKAVMITFDDGYYNNYLYAYPLLQKYAAHMVLSPICKWTDFYSEQSVSDARYTHVTWDQLREMTSSGLVELGNHSYDLHTNSGGRQGSAKKKGESTAAYQQLLTADLQLSQERFASQLGKVPKTYTYPFGAVSDEAAEVLHALGFEATMNCHEKVNTLSADETCLYHLGRFKRPHGISSVAFFQKILS